MHLSSTNIEEYPILPLVVVGGLVAKLCPTLETPWIIDHEDPLSIRFPRHKYWSGLPCPPPGNLPDSGTEHSSPVSPALQADSLPLVTQMIKNPPAMQETQVLSLGWEDPLEKGMTTHSSLLA